jgi:hypothetical protein
MNDGKSVSLFGGRVLKATLPVFRPGEAPPEARIKRLQLAQGELCQIYDGDGPGQGLLYLATVQLLPGQVRGNHYHKAKREWFYLTCGSLKVILRDRVSGGRDELQAVAGDRIYLAPEIEHVLVPLETGYAVEYSPDTFDPADTFRADLLGA